MKSKKMWFNMIKLAFLIDRAAVKVIKLMKNYQNKTII